MKISGFLAILLVFLVTLLQSPKALAVGSGALPVRHIFSAAGGAVVTWQHTELVASTQKGIEGVQVNNTSLRPLELAFGPANGEVNQVIIGANQDTGFLPLSGGYATRISVVALDGPAETGEIELNAFYN